MTTVRVAGNDVDGEAPAGPTSTVRRARQGLHDCIADHCDSDPRSAEDVWGEGYAAFGHGATYKDVPYGHHHADIRFNWWVNGWAEGRYQAGLCRFCDSRPRNGARECAQCRRASA